MMRADEHPLIGCEIDELDTPVLILDLDCFEANVAHLAATCARLGINWRPHSKGHKCAIIAQQLLAAGAIGLTCAKLSEAEIFIAAGVDNILVANQLGSPFKARRLARLQQRARVIGIIDCPEAVRLLANAASAESVSIGVLIDIDTGMHRSGVAAGPALGELAQLVADSQGLHLQGIMGYEGHAIMQPLATKAEVCAQAIAQLAEARKILEDLGHPVEIVSAGGTGSYEWSASLPGLTELQAGGGIFMDALYRDACHVGEDLQFALTLLTTVSGVSADHIVTDAGFKTLSAFHHPPRVLNNDGFEFGYLSAEHGVYRRVSGAAEPTLGQRLRLLPGYHDSTNFLHDEFVCIRKGIVEQVWPLVTRGALT